MSGGRAGKPWREWFGAVPIAHRGLHDAAVGRPENGLSAFAAAAQRGYAIELDLRLSSDGAVMVFHDLTLQRLIGVPAAIGGLTRSELSGLLLAGSHDHIPALPEVLDLVGGRVPLYLELKSDGPGDGRLAEAVTDLLRSYPGPVALMSLEPKVLRSLRKSNESRPVGLISYRYDDEWARDHFEPYQRTARRHLFPALTAGVDFVAYDVDALPAVAPLIAKWIFGMPLLAWTVKTPLQQARAARWADQMIFESFDPGLPAGESAVPTRHLRLVASNRPQGRPQ